MKTLGKGLACGAFWVTTWVGTGSWPVLFAAIWLVIALTNPPRQPRFPGVATWLWARDLWRATRRGKVGVVGRTRPRLVTTQRSQA